MLFQGGKLLNQSINHLGVVVDQLDVARLEAGFHAQLVAGSQLVEELDGLQLLLRQARHLRVALAQEKVVVAVVHRQVALRQGFAIWRACGSLYAAVNSRATGGGQCREETTSPPHSSEQCRSRSYAERVQCICVHLQRSRSLDTEP